MSLNAKTKACLPEQTTPVASIEATPRFQPGRGPNGEVLNVGFSIVFKDEDGKALSPTRGFKPTSAESAQAIAEAVMAGAKAALEACPEYKAHILSAYGISL